VTFHPPTDTAKMSWESFVETLKGYSENVSEAFIIGKDGTPWTTLPDNLKVSSDELKSIVNLVVNKTPTGNILFGEKKYYVLRSVNYEEEGICQTLAKLKEYGGLCFTTTNQTIIVSYTTEEKIHGAGAANEAALKIATYLTSLGYWF